MAAVTFVGDGRSDPSVMRSFGYEFKLNVPLEINDPTVVAKLKKNCHYRVAETAPEPSPVAPLAPENSENADFARRAEIVGLKIDKRWSAVRLKSEIEAAEAAHKGA